MSLYISVYLGTDTQTKIKILASGVPVDLSDITRITLAVNGEIVDSDIATDAFEWLNTDKTGEVWLKLGPYLTTKKCSPSPARITLYDILTPNGYVADESCETPSLYISVC